MAAVNVNKKALSSATTDTWVSSPADSDNVSDGASAVRDTKATLRAVVSQEHYIDDDSTGDGIHVEGSARVFVEDDTAVEPTHSERGRTVFYPESRSLKVSDGNDFLPVGGTYPGLVTMSAVAPTPASDLWALCDGQYVERASDDGIWDSLIDRLAGSGADGSYLPDLRDRFVRGANTAGNGSLALQSGARTVNTQTGATTADDAFDFQEHAFEDHDHQMDHTHGASIVSGYDSGNGSTGSPTWNTGTVTLEKDLVDASSAGATFDGTSLKVIPFEADRSVSEGGGDAANDAWIDVNLQHRHAIARYWGLTRLASVQSEDIAHGVPERTYNTADETRPDNVVLYYVIKL